MYRGNYDIVDYAYIVGGSPYSDNDPVYDSTQFPDNAATGHNGANDTRFSSPAMDAALKILQTAVDPAGPADRHGCGPAGLRCRPSRDPDLLPRRDHRCRRPCLATGRATTRARSVRPGMSRTGSSKA